GRATDAVRLLGLAEIAPNRIAGNDPAIMLTAMGKGGGSPIGEALAWASRVMAVGLAMFLPAVAGGWVDRWLGTAWIGLVGLVVGFVAGLTWLVRMTRRETPT
ncbi:MAG: hypothetical protein WED27_09215, partial [Pirellulales bacterium]